MRRAAFAILGLMILAMGSFGAGAFEAAIPTEEQAARCQKIPDESAQRFCLAGYRVAPLKLPTEVSTYGAFSSTGKMAIYTPDGPGPFPALLIMHTCGMIVPEQTGYWVKSAIANGFAAFIIDSWTQRGLMEGECGGSVPPGFNAMAVRIRDAFDALAQLEKFPSIDAKRVAAIGFSHGGRVAYMLANPNFAAMYSPPERRFIAAVAVYGECYNRPIKFVFLRKPIETPLLALLGDKDADGDVRECEPRLRDLKAEGAPVDWHIFPNTGHVWDQPNFRSAQMHPYAGSPTGTVLYKYDSAVTDESRDRAFAFINAQMTK